MVEREAVRSLNLPMMRLNIKQLTSLLRPLKRKTDGTSPTKKEELRKKYNEWIDHPVSGNYSEPQLNGENDALDDEGEDFVETAVIDAMMNLHRSAVV